MLGRLLSIMITLCMVGWGTIIPEGYASTRQDWTEVNSILDKIQGLLGPQAEYGLPMETSLRSAIFYGIHQFIWNSNGGI